MLALLIDRVGPHKPGVELWDLASRALLTRFDLDPYESVAGLRFTPEGAVLLGYAHRSLYSWDVAKKTSSKKTFPAASYVGNVVFSRDGQRCLTHINAFSDTSYDREKEFNKLRVFDTEQYRLLWSLDGLNKRDSIQRSGYCMSRKRRRLRRSPRSASMRIPIPAPGVRPLVAGVAEQPLAASCGSG